MLNYPYGETGESKKYDQICQYTPYNKVGLLKSVGKFLFPPAHWLHLASNYSLFSVYIFNSCSTIHTHAM